MSVVSGQVPANTPKTPQLTEEQRQFRDLLGIDIEDTKSAIGVPKGYRIDRNRNIVASPGQPGIQPDFTFKYFEGAQYAPGAGDPTEILKLQLRLKEAGILNKKYVPGQWDQVSSAA